MLQTALKANADRERRAAEKAQAAVEKAQAMAASSSGRRSVGKKLSLNEY